MVEVRAGKGGSAKEYSIPAALLCNRSVFFKNALKEWWNEDEGRSVSLAEEDPEIIALYLHILYGEKVSLRSIKTDDPNRGRDCTLIKRDHITVVHLYRTLAARMPSSTSSRGPCTHTLKWSLAIGVPRTSLGLRQSR
jgi:hypothetical protein